MRHGVDSFMQILKDIGGVGGPLAGMAGILVYFRRQDRELRDELRLDNERLRAEIVALRAERAELRAEIDELDKQVDALIHQLRDRG